MEEVLKFLSENPIFYVATVEGDKPRVRPFGFFMEYENKLYFAVGSHKKAYQQMSSNPYVEISTASGKGEWIRISGKAVFDERPETTAKALEIVPSLKAIYNEESGLKLAPFYLTEAYAEIADFSGGFKKIALS
ncbi:MAG: pyridoxamine 5'-phosphate oxidase family protein [Syntrophomonas sp.]